MPERTSRWEVLLWQRSTLTVGKTYPGKSERSAFQERRTISQLINSFSHGVSRTAQTNLSHQCDQNSFPAANLLTTALIIHQLTLQLTCSSSRRPPLTLLCCHLVVESVYNTLFLILRHYKIVLVHSELCWSVDSAKIYIQRINNDQWDAAKNTYVGNCGTAWIQLEFFLETAPKADVGQIKRTEIKPDIS